MKKIEENIAKIPKCALDKSWEKCLKKYRKIICEIQGETLEGIPEQKKTPALILRELQEKSRVKEMQQKVLCVQFREERRKESQKPRNYDRNISRYSKKNPRGPLGSIP